MGGCHVNENTSGIGRRARGGAGAGPANADIKIGVVLALTGPNSSLGIPYRKGVELMPKEVGRRESAIDLS